MAKITLEKTESGVDDILVDECHGGKDLNNDEWNFISGMNHVINNIVTDYMDNRDNESICDMLECERVRITDSEECLAAANLILRDFSSYAYEEMLDAIISFLHGRDII